MSFLKLSFNGVAEMNRKVMVRNHEDEEIGKAVFALVDIEADEVVVESCPVQVLTQRNKYSLELNGCHLIISEPGIFTNHSCSPNCVLAENEQGAFDFIAARKILQGEEITIDYMSNESEVTAFNTCLCNAENCRKQMNARPILLSH